ncbi:MAG TPA: alpha/beta hydrolase [Limnochordia bacterium]|nr:alpha/beta hydrolase [Limnochordia bacterium]
MKQRIGMILLTFIILLSIFILMSYINHRVQLANEDELFVPLGRLVEVDGRMFHVYSEGSGEVTLVFMSGGGTSSPVLDFKSLYSLLSDRYRIVVIEKTGYGFSEVADVDRDIESVLTDTRQALALAGLEGPFVLCPHSMSGIEAMYWAQSYPDEVTAIVGLDMAVPGAYENYEMNLPMIRLGKFMADTGIIRWIPGIAESDAIKYGALTDAEKELYRVVFYRRTATRTMLNEVQQIETNAEVVEKGGAIQVPVLMFSSNGQGTGWDADEWRGHQYNFIAGVSQGTLIELDCAHYVHDIEYERIADEIRSYLDEICR